jgi:PLP dependent protein
VEALLAAYQAGQRIFGENYVQEIVEKSQAKAIQELDDLEFHFIGKLQSNKVALLIKNVKQLSMIETIDTTKLANKVNNTFQSAIEEGIRSNGDTLKVMIQVNSSGEPQKGGVENKEEAIELASFIVNQCSHLKLVGLMTIGRADYTAGPENFDFLKSCRDAVSEALGVETSSLQLSMGMSNDYVLAIEHGSTSVRVGSSIFGKRVYPPTVSSS